MLAGGDHEARRQTVGAAGGRPAGAVGGCYDGTDRRGIPLFAQPAYLICAPGIGCVQQRSYLSEEESAAQAATSGREKGGPERATRGWHLPIATHYYVLSARHLKFRGRCGRLGLAE